jgi:hypothetical protein
MTPPAPHHTRIALAARSPLSRGRRLASLLLFWIPWILLPLFPAIGAFISWLTGVR